MGGGGGSPFRHCLKRKDLFFSPDIFQNASLTCVAQIGHPSHSVKGRGGCGRSDLLGGTGASSLGKREQGRGGGGRGEGREEGRGERGDWVKEGRV